MAVAKQVKLENAKLLQEEFAEVPHAILVDFKGLNVEAATDLRRQLRDGEAKFKVVKNSTALHAIEDLPLGELDDVFVGQTAIAYTDGDAVALAKVLREFHKAFETPSFKAGIVDGTPITADDFEALAKLPPRQDLIANVVFLLNYPITGLATALQGIVQGFVVALDQVREQKAAAGDEPAADAAENASTETEVAAEAAENTPAEAEVVAEAAENTPAEAEVAADAAENTSTEAEVAADAAESTPTEEK